MCINPLPCGTLATFFLTAVGPIQHTKEGDISREKILTMSLRLERAAAVRWRPLLITPLPPRCKGQCVQSNVMTQVRANRAAAVRKRRWLRPPMSDEVADGVVRTAMKRCIHRHLDQMSLRPPLNQRYLRPPMLDTAADGLIETAMKICIYRDPHTLIRGPWGHRDHFDTHTIFPAKSIGLIEPLPLGIVVIYNAVILSRGRLYMTYTLSMVQKKIIYRLIRPKLSNVMISKQAWDTSWGIPNFWQYLAWRTFRVFCILIGVWPKGPIPVRERVKSDIESTNLFFQFEKINVSI